MNSRYGDIPEEIVDDVLELASNYYQKAESSYSLDMLQEAGSEVQIPPEFVKKALKEVQRQHQLKVEQQQKAKEQRQMFVYASAGLAALIFAWGIITYNSISGSVQEVDSRWAQIENQLQRRTDLIPQLVNLAQTQAGMEQELIDKLVQARQLYLEADNTTTQQEAIAAVNGAISQFNLYAGTNPQLQSSQAFQNLSYEVAGTENRITVERMRYNQAVRDYNQKINSFPNSLIAGLGGFGDRSFFEVQANSSPGSQ